jgi:hypothetical protein
MPEVESSTVAALLWRDIWSDESRAATESVRCVENEDCFRVCEVGAEGGAKDLFRFFDEGEE